MAEVSRQFTDAERALDERVDAFIFAPKYTPDSSAPQAAAYAAMRQDVKDRSIHAQQLKEQQELAFAASARRKLHALAESNDAQTKAAHDAVKTMTKLIGPDGGMTKEQAAAQLIDGNPSLALNPVFGKAIKFLDTNIEDTREAALNEAKSEMDRIGFLAATEKNIGIWTMEKFKNQPEQLALRIQQAKLVMEGAVDDAQKKKFEAKIGAMEAQASYWLTQNNPYMRAWKSQGQPVRDPNAPDQFLPGTTFDGRLQGEILESFARIGATNIQDVNTLIGFTTNSMETGFIADVTLIDELAKRHHDPESGEPFNQLSARKAMLDKITALSDPGLRERAANGDAEAARIIQTGRNIIMTGGAMYGRKYAKLIQQDEWDDTLRDIQVSAIKGRNVAVQEHRNKLPAAFANVQTQLYSKEDADDPGATPVFGKSDHDQRTADLASQEAQSYLLGLFVAADDQNGKDKYNDYVTRNPPLGWGPELEGDSRASYLENIRDWMTNGFEHVKSIQPGTTAPGGMPSGTAPAPTSPGGTVPPAPGVTPTSGGPSATPGQVTNTGARNTINDSVFGNPLDTGDPFISGQDQNPAPVPVAE